MSLNHDENTHTKPRGSILATRAGLVLLGFLIIGGFLLLTEHQAHALGAIFWLLPFACVIMHLFMHSGHAGHGGHSHGNRTDRSPS